VDAAQRWAVSGGLALALSLVAAAISYGVVERPMLLMVQRRRLAD
jgi:peptidoglycan/LPS O-acetylase OafA/YrhL